MLGTGFRTFGKFSRNSLVACSSLEVTDKGLGKDLCQNEKYTLEVVSFLPPSECIRGAPIRRCIVFGVSCWLTWASECKRPLGRPFCPFLQEATGNQWEGVPSWRSRSGMKTSQVNRTEQYPLPSIDALVDSASGCKMLSFLDAFVGDGCCPFKIVFDEDFYVHFMCIFALL